jgi:hypothetical protein
LPRHNHLHFMRCSLLSRAYNFINLFSPYNNDRS